MSQRGLRGLIERLRHPQTTVRWRLTLLYGGLFLVCGATLLAVTYALVSHASVLTGPRAVFTRFPPGPNIEVKAGPPIKGTRPSALPNNVISALKSSAGQAVVRSVGVKQRVTDLHQLEIESGIALAIMVIVSGLLGWLVAGRVLRPLRTITLTTRRLSEANLHERLSLAGPRDELRTLADTIDGLLERLETAFNAQRRFVTNASHELRTPLTASRALLEMAVSDPGATVASLRTACHEALEESEQQEQLIDALLALAQGERGLDVREPFDLAALAREVQDVYAPEAADHGLAFALEAESVDVFGDRRLLGRLVSNLVQNAIRHNLPRGWVRVQVENHAGEARLLVANSGPVVSEAEIPRLLQPFQRVSPDRVGHRDGFGLGLSIVAAVAAAHQAALDIQPGPEGGLSVEVRFLPLPQAAGSESPASGVADDAQDDRPGRPPSRVEDEPQVGVG